MLELHEYRENNSFALIHLKHHINYEIPGCKQKLTLDKTRGNGDLVWDETQVLRESKEDVAGSWER